MTDYAAVVKALFDEKVETDRLVLEALKSARASIFRHLMRQHGDPEMDNIALDKVDEALRRLLA